MTESWQIFKVAKNKLAAGTLEHVFDERAAALDDWASDPRYCYEQFYNPIDEMREFLAELRMAGLDELAWAAIQNMWGKKI